MEPDATSGSTAVIETDPSAQPSAQPEAGGSGQDWHEAGPSEESKAFRALIASGGRSGVTTVTSKPSTADPDGGSTPEGDVKPSAPDRGADGKFVPRRGVQKALAEADAKVAAAPDPDQLREQIRAEVRAEQQTAADNAKLDELAQSKAADVARYRQLLEVPDAEMSGDDYQFREDFKERLRLIPEVESTHRELARQTIEAERKALSTKEVNFLNGIYDQVATLASKAGIDPEKWKAKGVDFAVMAEDYATARVSAREAEVRAELGAEIRRLQDANQQFRLTGSRGLGAARTGLNGGVSGTGAPDLNANDIFRSIVRGEPVA